MMLDIQEQMNEKIADAIKSFLLHHDIAHDVRIYFNNKAYQFDSEGFFEKTIEDIKATDYIEFANNDTVSMSFEGPFYNVMNLSFENSYYQNLQEKFEKLVNEFGYYYELGYAWSLSLYKCSNCS